MFILKRNMNQRWLFSSLFARVAILSFNIYIQLCHSNIYQKHRIKQELSLCTQFCSVGVLNFRFF